MEALGGTLDTGDDDDDVAPVRMIEPDRCCLLTCTGDCSPTVIELLIVAMLVSVLLARLRMVSNMDLGASCLARRSAGLTVLLLLLVGGPAPWHVL